MTKSIREKIYYRIRDEITYGKLFPGERITQSRFVAKFKASRTPIREALRQLESEGLIKFERNKGFSVSKLSIKQVDETFSLRWLLESYATRLFAEKTSKNDVAYLKGVMGKLRVAAQTYDIEAWEKNNDLFHYYIFSHCGNSDLISLINYLKRRVYRYKYVMIRYPVYFKQYIKDHEGILKGCQENDGKMAEKYARLHLEMTKKVVIDHLNSFGLV
jgi:DNA-binding GntR family transcriptional regulator